MIEKKGDTVKQNTIYYSLLAMAALIIIALFMLQGTKTMYAQIHSVTDVKNVFPSTPLEIQVRVDESIKQAQKTIDALIAIPAAQRTFANTAKELDEISALSNIAIMAHVFEILEMVSPEDEIRASAHEASIKLQEFFIDAFGNNVALYNAFKEYVDGNAKKESLSEKDWYFLDELMSGFKRSGLNLPDAQRAIVAKLKKELASLTLQFESNIAAEQRTFVVSKDKLAGLSEEFIEQLKKTDEGHIVLGTDYPTFIKVMENCSVAHTRKQMFELYNNRAYPINDALLKDIVAKRDELAHLLGFESYAAYELDDEMVKITDRARSFLDDLVEQVKKKVDQEVAMLTKKLPVSVQLTNGKLSPWDTAYLKNQYKKDHLQIDEQLIAQYFPMEKTIAGLLGIYEQFFSLQFKRIAISGMWHNDVELLAVYPAGKDTLLGYFLLDLYPRPFKYTHACHATIVPSTFVETGKPNTALSVVIANFPRAIADKPALLERKYVETFFHEFGHALHALLGRTKMASLSGTHVKTDFVELPSQMLEEWLTDKEILKMISGHYKTQEPLSDDVIEKILSLKKFDAGLFVQTQAYYARISLDLFGPGAHKDPFELMQQLYVSIRSHFVFDKNDHMYASFGHLTNYGAKYYGYLWSKVFALDIFDQIKKEGLLNPVVGARYVDCVIGQGGSVDPNVLLEKFLGRKPNQEAFLKDLGLKNN